MQRILRESTAIGVGVSGLLTYCLHSHRSTQSLSYSNSDDKPISNTLRFYLNYCLSRAYSDNGTISDTLPQTTTVIPNPAISTPAISTPAISTPVIADSITTTASATVSDNDKYENIQYDFATNEEDDKEEWNGKAYRCMFCKAFLDSPCRVAFMNWSKCVDKCKEKGDDVNFVEVCSDYTSTLHGCVVHFDVDLMKYGGSSDATDSEETVETSSSDSNSERNDSSISSNRFDIETKVEH